MVPKLNLRVRYLVICSSGRLVNEPSAILYIIHLAQIHDESASENRGLQTNVEVSNLMLICVSGGMSYYYICEGTKWFERRLYVPDQSIRKASLGASN